MSIRILGPDGVRSALSMKQCIEVMGPAMRATSNGKAVLPGRQVLELPAGLGYLGLMPGACADPNSFGAKIVSVRPQNPGQGLPMLQGAVLIFDPATGAPVALMDAATLTALRTAAVSGLATRLLAREESSTVAIFGTGVQAASHLEAMQVAGKIKRFIVWGRDEKKSRLFCAEQSHRLSLEVEFVPSAEEAASLADIICTVTSAKEPVLLARWLKPGTHVNLVGSHDRAHRECDRQLIVESRLFVDKRSSAITDAGEIMEALESNVITSSHIVAELGELVESPDLGRQHQNEITVFKSVGIISQDLLAADRAWRNAVLHGLGTVCSF